MALISLVDKMTAIVKPKNGQLLELKVNAEGFLQDTDIIHNPKDFSVLGIVEFQYTTRKDVKDNNDIRKEYHSKLQAFASNLGADMIQIIKESTEPTEPQPWGTKYETMITMYVK